MDQLKDTLKKLYRSTQFFNEIDRTKYIRMDGNESVDGLPESFVQDTLKKVTPSMLAAYPNPKSCTEGFAEYIGVSREKILLTNGSDAAIKMFYEAYVEQGDRVIIATPAFEMYEVYCNMYGATPIHVDYSDDFVFPIEAYIKEIENGAKAAFITNPNNPNGVVIDERLIRRILDSAQAKDVLIILDEAYYWIYDQTMIHLLKEYSNLIVLRTFSKILGLAGLRLGCVIASEDIILDIKKVAPPAGVNVIALLFGEELIKRPDLIENLILDFNREKEYFKFRLNECGITFIDTYSNYLLIPVDGDPKNKISYLRDQGILVAYKMNRYIRVNIGNESLIDRFVDAYIHATKIE